MAEIDKEGRAILTDYYDREYFQARQIELDFSVVSGGEEVDQYCKNELERSTL